MKTYIGITTGYKVIRIDYIQINNIGKHIIEGINSNIFLYLSTVELYKWLFNTINVDFAVKHCPVLFNK